LKEAIQHAINGRAILFTGAGFSFRAKNIDGQKLPTGEGLASELLSEIGRPGKILNLDRAASAYLRKKTPSDLINLLIKKFTIQTVTESHRCLAKLPWKRAYTTNYDLVFEEASKLESMVCNSIDAADEPKDHLYKRNLIIHINGAINRLSEQRLNSTFKLLNESYAADAFEHSGWAFHFRNDIRNAAAVIFIGYSMYDLDIRRVLFNEEIQDKCLFIVAPKNDDNEFELEDLSTLGNVAPIGIDEFANFVTKEIENHTPLNEELLLEFWSEIQELSDVSTTPTDGEIIDFLTEGRVNNPILMEALGPNSRHYLIDHILIDRLKEELPQLDVPAVLIGELGTGKSFALDKVGRYFVANGWRVFRLTITDKDEIAEAESICKEPGRKILIVENYQRHIDLLRWIAETKPENIRIILSARSSIHELFVDDLFGIFSQKIQEYDISELRPTEIQNVVELFDNFGFWGDRIGWRSDRKRKFVRDECGSSLPSLLVHILKSRHITERYKDLLNNMSNASDVEAVLICAFSLEVIGFAPRIFHIQELLGNRVNWAKFKSQSELTSIIDITKHTVNARSSVLALHLLHSVFSPKRIVETLVGMAAAAEERRGNKEYGDILNSLMRYKNISSILPDDQRLPTTVNFYEGVKNFPSTARNPQFWLQYAIACLALGRLERAERYFDDAYDFVYEGYNTFMLDNSYSRLLLEKCMYVARPDDTIIMLEKVREIIFSQMRSERRYYPYRVALGFFKIYDRFKGSWTPKQYEYFMFIFKEIKRNINLLDGKLKDHKYVRECLELAAQAMGENNAT